MKSSASLFKNSPTGAPAHIEIVKSPAHMTESRKQRDDKQWQLQEAGTCQNRKMSDCSKLESVKNCSY